MRYGVYVMVSTNDQRNNGYYIDSQLRMINCENNEYVFIINNIKKGEKLSK